MLIVVIAFSATNRRFRFTSRSLAIITALLASCSPANAAGGFADLISPPFCFLDDDPVIVGQRYMDFHHLEVILYAFVISFFAVLILFLMLATASSLLLAIFYFFFPGALLLFPFSRTRPLLALPPQRRPLLHSLRWATFRPRSMLSLRSLRPSSRSALVRATQSLCA